MAQRAMDLSMNPSATDDQDTLDLVAVKTGSHHQPQESVAKAPISRCPP